MVGRVACCGPVGLHALFIFFVHGKGSGSDIKRTICHRGVLHGTTLVRHSAPGPSAFIAMSCDLITGDSRRDRNGQHACLNHSFGSDANVGFFSSRLYTEQIRDIRALHIITPDFTKRFLHLHLYEYQSSSFPPITASERNRYGLKRVTTSFENTGRGTSTDSAKLDSELSRTLLTTTVPANSRLNDNLHNKRIFLKVQQNMPRLSQHVRPTCLVVPALAQPLHAKCANLKTFHDFALLHSIHAATTAFPELLRLAPVACLQTKLSFRPNGT